MDRQEDLPFLESKWFAVQLFSAEYSFYSGRKAPSHKMQMVSFTYYYYYYYYYFGGGSTSGLMLIGSRPPRDTFEFFSRTVSLMVDSIV